MSTLWTGFSPVAAVVVLNMIFKHGLKMPSPLKPGAALAYGAAIGGIGMAAGAGVESLFNRAKNKGRNGLRQGGRTMQNLRGRNQQMAPATNGTQTMVPKNDPTPARGSGAPTATAASTAAAAATAPEASRLPTDPSTGAAVVPAPAGTPAVTSAEPSDAAEVAAPKAPAPVLSAVAQRAAELKQQRLANKFHKTGGVELQTGRAAPWHRRTNTKLLAWSDRFSTPGGNVARSAAAGVALLGVAGARGAVGVIDNAQQRVVRRRQGRLEQRRPVQPRQGPSQARDGRHARPPAADRGRRRSRGARRRQPGAVGRYWCGRCTQGLQQGSAKGQRPSAERSGCPPPERPAASLRHRPGPLERLDRSSERSRTGHAGYPGDRRELGSGSRPGQNCRQHRTRSHRAPRTRRRLRRDGNGSNPIGSEPQQRGRFGACLRGRRTARCTRRRRRCVATRPAGFRTRAGMDGRLRRAEGNEPGGRTVPSEGPGWAWDGSAANSQFDQGSARARCRHDSARFPSGISSQAR